MPKRQRAASESDCRSTKRIRTPAQPLPLTAANLARLQAAHASSRRPPSPMSRRTPSPKRPSNNIDHRDKLEAYRIHVDQERALPPALAEHISAVVRRARSPPASPNAAQVVQRRRYAAVQSERNGVKLMAPYLLFVGAVDDDCRVAQEPLIATKHDTPLSRFFLPPAPNQAVQKAWKELSQPQPDSCTGYVTRRDATFAPVQPCAAAFSEEEERMLDSYRLSQFVHFPFLTAQFKASNANETLRHAQYQAARDGAVAVNYLFDLYLAAYKQPPSVVDTSHFSLTCDLANAELWVHWREGLDHYMELVLTLSLRDLDAVVRLRSHLHNILDWARGPRLDAIKTALPHFNESQRRGDFPAIPIVPESVTSVSDNASSCSTVGFGLPMPLPQEFVFYPPMTPMSSVSSEPPKPPKRKRDASISSLAALPTGDDGLDGA